jgi:hypothetical protein
MSAEASQDGLEGGALEEFEASWTIITRRRAEKPRMDKWDGDGLPELAARCARTLHKRRTINTEPMGEGDLLPSHQNGSLENNHEFSNKTSRHSSYLHTQTCPNSLVLIVKSTPENQLFALEVHRTCTPATTPLRDITDVCFYLFPLVLVEIVDPNIVPECPCSTVSL